jgi:hypothetical protein
MIQALLASPAVPAPARTKTGKRSSDTGPYKAVSAYSDNSVSNLLAWRSTAESKTDDGDKLPALQPARRAAAPAGRKKPTARKSESSVPKAKQRKSQDAGTAAQAVRAPAGVDESTPVVHKPSAMPSTARRATPSLQFESATDDVTATTTAAVPATAMLLTAAAPVASSAAVEHLPAVQKQAAVRSTAATQSTGSHNHHGARGKPDGRRALRAADSSKLLQLETKFDILRFTGDLPAEFLNERNGKGFLQERGYWKLCQIKAAFWRRKKYSAFYLWRVRGETCGWTGCSWTLRVRA